MIPILIFNQLKLKIIFFDPFLLIENHNSLRFMVESCSSFNNIFDTLFPQTIHFISSFSIFFNFYIFHIRDYCNNAIQLNNEKSLKAKRTWQWKLCWIKSILEKKRNYHFLNQCSSRSIRILISNFRHNFNLEISLYKIYLS